MLVTGCEDTQKIRELEQELASLQKKLDREKESLQDKDKKREQVVKQKLQGVEDVVEVRRQMGLQLKAMAETAKKLDDHITSLEKLWQQESEQHAALLKSVRASDIGRTVSAITVKNGQAYFEVKFVSFGEDSVQIRHKSGEAKVPYDQLPDALRDRYSPPGMASDRLPPRPVVDMNAVSDFSKLLFEFEVDRIRDKRLADYFSATNRSLLKISELRQNLADKKRELAILQGEMPAESRPASGVGDAGSKMTAEKIAAMAAKIKTGSQRIVDLKAEQNRLANEIAQVDTDLYRAKLQFEDIEGKIRDENSGRGIRQVESDLQKRITSSQNEFRKKNAWLPEKKANLESQKAEIDKQLREAELALTGEDPVVMQLDDSSPALRSLNEAKLQLRNFEADQQRKSESKSASLASQISSLKFSVRELNRQLDSALQEQMARVTWIDKRLLELVREAES